MNTDVIIKDKPTSQRVRIITDRTQTGVVFDVTEDGWLLWVGDDGFCHMSEPSYVEVVS